MNLSTLEDAKNSDICEVLNLSPSDPRFLKRLNEAQLLLLPKGKWVGTVDKYSICVNNGEITWPRQVSTIEAAAVCRRPIVIRNRWYEYLSSGWGELRECDGCHTALIDRGMACTVSDVVGDDKKLKLVCDLAEDVGKLVLVQGIDAVTGEPVMTQVGSDWIQGEFIAASIAGTLSTKTYLEGKLIGIQKPVSQGRFRLYEYDTVELAQRLLSVYEPDEKLPWYRRSLIPGLSQTTTCPCEPCSTTPVTPTTGVQQIYTGNGAPSILPDDPTLPAAYWDKQFKITYWWNTDSQAWE